MRRFGEVPVGAPGGMMDECDCGCPGCGVDCGCSCCQGVSGAEDCPKCGKGLLHSDEGDECSCSHEEPVLMVFGESCSKCAGDEPCEECSYMNEKSCSECGGWMEEGTCTECGMSEKATCDECGGDVMEGICKECGMSEHLEEAKGRRKKRSNKKKGPNKKAAKKILKGTKTFAAKMKKVSGWADNPPAAAAWMMHKATGKWPREK